MKKKKCRLHRQCIQFSCGACVNRWTTRLGRVCAIRSEPADGSRQHFVWQRIPRGACSEVANGVTTAPYARRISRSVSDVTQRLTTSVQSTLCPGLSSMRYSKKIPGVKSVVWWKKGKVPDCVVCTRRQRHVAVFTPSFALP